MLLDDPTDQREQRIHNGKILKSVRNLCKAIEHDDKDSFKLNLNHILCVRNWHVLPELMDKFESMNEGKDIHHFIKILLGRNTAEAFQSLCVLI